MALSLSASRPILGVVAKGYVPSSRGFSARADRAGWWWGLVDGVREQSAGAMGCQSARQGSSGRDMCPADLNVRCDEVRRQQSQRERHWARRAPPKEPNAPLVFLASRNRPIKGLVKASPLITAILPHLPLREGCTR